MFRSAALAALVCLLACSSEDSPVKPPPRPPPILGAQNVAPAPSGSATAEAPTAPASGESTGGELDLAGQGKSIYGQVCIACHAMDPNQEGALGPAIAGSSLPLLEAKVLHNEYPEGYTPQRTTKNMVPLAYLEKDLPALAAYLSEAAN